MQHIDYLNEIELIKIYNWIIENLNEKWFHAGIFEVKTDNVCIVFGFESESDAMVFKLGWTNTEEDLN